MSPRELAVLLVLCIVWAFHYIVLKTTVTDTPPIFYAALRMTLVALVMAPFLTWKSGRMGALFLAGLCMGAVNYVFLFVGVKYATASAAAIANELYVPFATILSVVFLKEHIGPPRLIGIALAFAGVAVIVLARGEAPTEARIGVGVGFVTLATLTEAFGAILVKKLGVFRPWELLAWFGLIGAAVLWPLTLFLEDGQQAALFAGDRPRLMGAVFYSALLASIFGHTTYYWLIQRRPVSMIAPSTLLVAMLAIGLSIAILGDPFTTPFLIGSVLTLIGVGIVVLRSPRTAPEPGAPEPIVVAPPRLAEKRT